IKDTFDPQASKPSILPNTTAVMIHFHPPDTNQSETWSPSPAPSTVNPVCTNATGTTGNPPTHCDIVNVHNFTLSGDQPTISGGTKRNSMFISAYSVPMLETQVTVNGVAVNTPGVQGSTTVSVPFQPAGNTV